MKKILSFLSLCFIPLVYAQDHLIQSNNDSILHTTVFHNWQHATLDFLVTFAVGYGDANHCATVKKRVFKATHTDNCHAHNYGKFLAQEYGPALYSCVKETLHVIGSNYPDQVVAYALSNNGVYYTAATPNVSHIYPR